MKMIVDTKVRKCDNLAGGVFYEVACKDAKYYGMDAGGKTVDLCPECFRIYCLLVALKSIATPFIMCEFCGNAEVLNPRIYNYLHEFMDDRFSSSPRTAKVACTKCYSVYMKTQTGVLNGPGLVPEFQVEELKKKLGLSK
jgi:hypothetical protein